MTDLLLAGGGGLVAALGCAIWALVERARVSDLRLLLAGERHRADSAERTAADAVKEMRDAAAANLVEVDTRETAIAAQRLHIANLERELEKYAARDPVLAGELLEDEINRPDDPPDGGRGVHPATGRAVDPVRDGQGR